MCAGTLVVVVLGVFVYRLCHGSAMGMCKPAPDAVHLMENGGTSDLHSGTYALEHLKLSVVVGKFMDFKWKADVICNWKVTSHATFC